MPPLRELLAAAVERNASDVHLKAGEKPFLRVHAELEPAADEPMTPAELQEIAEAILPEHLRDTFRSEHEADFSLVEEGLGRFRVNIFHGSGLPAMAFRHVQDRIPSFEDLHLPAVLRKLALSPRGIVVASGTTGCGKSTTLAAMIEHVNQHLRRRIVTIEDPVEYVFSDKQSVVSQREVGLDTRSFHSALRHVLRQDPDVIMIGEMRDAESFTAALAAAETGHLVFSTLHAGTGAQVVPRIMDLFPSAERDQVRMALASNLRAAVCQRLIPSVDGGVRPAVEVLINTPTARKLIAKDALDKLPAAIETGVEDGMQTFNQAIFDLIKAGDITEEQGMKHAGNAEALRMNLRGIFLDESRRILST